MLRDYRNYIHPEKERSHGIVLTSHDSAMLRDVTKNLARQVLASAQHLLTLRGATMTEDLIVADPQILGGKPCVRGTRLSVEFLLELAASGATQEQILAQYPQLTREGLAAAFRYAAEALKGEHTWALKIRA